MLTKKKSLALFHFQKFFASFFPVYDELIKKSSQTTSESFNLVQLAQIRHALCFMPITSSSSSSTLSVVESIAADKNAIQDRLSAILDLILSSLSKPLNQEHSAKLVDFMNKSLDGACKRFNSTNYPSLSAVPIRPLSETSSSESVPSSDSNLSSSASMPDSIRFDISASERMTWVSALIHAFFKAGARATVGTLNVLAEVHARSGNVAAIEKHLEPWAKKENIALDCKYAHHLSNIYFFVLVPMTHSIVCHCG
jgi:hypothetical protein